MRRLPLLFTVTATFAACSSEDSPDATSGLDAAVGIDTPAGNDAESADAASDGGLSNDASLDAGSMDTGTSTTVIVAPPNTWTWVDVPGSRCINGSATGFGVNLNPSSDKVMIFLMGGNACFNQGSCFVTANLDGYGRSKFNNDRNGLNGSIFDRNNASNLFRDWNMVFVPYCSGDVYSGTIGQTQVVGSTYTFQGWTNMELFFRRIVATIPNPSDVVLTGSSAGGFGALINYDHLATMYGSNVRVTLIDDSGPPMSDTFVTPCLQDHFRQTWGMDNGPLASCPACMASQDSFITEYLDYILTKYPNRRFGVISSAQDSVIRGFWGFGNNNCANLLPGTQPPQYTGARFQMGLEDLRDNYFTPAGNARLWMPNGTQHVWLGAPPWNTTLDGVTLMDWINQAVTGDAAWRHVPD